MDKPLPIFRVWGRVRCSPHGQGGFTYIGLMIGLAVLGIAATATLETETLLQRRAAEQELLAIGAEFSAALASYAAATPANQPTAPAALQDLLRDPRQPAPVRHLRRLYRDPITGETTWGTVASPENQRIVGVYSRSAQQPLKIANFEVLVAHFEGSAHYHDWVFGSARPAVPVPAKP